MQSTEIDKKREAGANYPHNVKFFFVILEGALDRRKILLRYLKYTMQTQIFGNIITRLIKHVWLL